MKSDKVILKTLYLTLLSLFALLTVNFGCGGGGTGTLYTSATGAKVFELHGSFRPVTAVSSLNASSDSADLFESRYSVIAYCINDPNNPIGEFQYTGGTKFVLSLLMSDCSRTLVIAVKDKRTGRNVGGSVVGSLPKINDVPEDITRIVLEDFYVNESSMAEMLIASEKGVPEAPAASITQNDLQKASNNVLTLSADRAKSRPPVVGEIEKISGGRENIDQLAKAVRTVICIASSMEESSPVKQSITLPTVATASEFLSSFVSIVKESEKNPRVSGIISQNALDTALIFNGVKIDAQTPASLLSRTIAEIVPLVPAAAPEFNPGPGLYGQAQSVAITCATAGAVIIFTTDGTTPSAANGTKYFSPVPVSSTAVIAAIAMKPGMADSEVSYAGYNIAVSSKIVASPVFGPEPGEYGGPISLVISCPTSGAVIKYTLDGSEPSSAAANSYQGPVKISSSVTVKAQAFKGGMQDSPVMSAVYNIKAVQRVAGPVFSPAGGAYGEARLVSISCATEGASIIYTTDGTTPSAANGNIYSSPITVDKTSILSAVAVKEGFLDSGVVIAVYNIDPIAQVSVPVLTPDGGVYDSTQTVTISSATEGASIRYTLDGSVPSQANGLLYRAPFLIDKSITIKAIAIKPGMQDSRTASAVFTISAPQRSVSASVFIPDGGSFDSTVSVVLASSTVGAFIRYTLDGSEPSETAGNIYTSPIMIGSSATVRAVAFKSGLKTSSVASASYTIAAPSSIQYAAAPVFSPGGGSYSSTVSVELASATEGAFIRYTLDGSEPSETAGFIYGGPIRIGVSAMIKAAAFKAGMKPSKVVSASYTVDIPVVRPQAALPQFSPAGGTFTSAQSVAITTATSGAKVYYTVNGAVPTVSSAGYTGPFMVSTTMTVKAIAVKDGMAVSEVASADYVINAPVISGGGGGGAAWCLHLLRACRRRRWLPIRLRTMSITI